MKPFVAASQRTSNDKLRQVVTYGYAPDVGKRRGRKTTNGTLSITRSRGDRCFLTLNQSQSGIYIDTGLGSAANTIIPANAGIQGILQNVPSWTPACAGATKEFVPTGSAINALPIAEADSGVWLNLVFTLILV